MVEGCIYLGDHLYIMNWVEEETCTSAVERGTILPFGRNDDFSSTSSTSQRSFRTQTRKSR